MVEQSLHCQLEIKTFFGHLSFEENITHPFCSIKHQKSRELADLTIRCKKKKVLLLHLCK